jgi:hypothetical protein
MNEPQGPRIDRIVQHPDKDPGNLFYRWLMCKLGLPPLTSFSPEQLLEGMHLDHRDSFGSTVSWSVSYQGMIITVRALFRTSGRVTSSISFAGTVSYASAARFVADCPAEAQDGVALHYWTKHAPELESETVTVRQCLQGILPTA